MDWLEEYKNGNNKSLVMCAYKLIKVEFKYWGMQVNAQCQIFSLSKCSL